jgi:hypothetical protein
MIRMGIVTAAIAVLVSAGAAEAARCPSGQIWRVSKKMCQSKALAVKLGIIKSGKGKAQFVKKRKSIKPRAAAATNKPAPADAAPKPAVIAKPAVEKPAPVTSQPAPPQAIKAESPKDPFQAITAIAPLRGAQPAQRAAVLQGAQPLPTRMVKAMYFSSATGSNPVSARDSAIARRAVLNLLKSRLEVHVERNRHRYIAADSGG